MLFRLVESFFLRGGLYFRGGGKAQNTSGAPTCRESWCSFRADLKSAIQFLKAAQFRKFLGLTLSLSLSPTGDHGTHLTKVCEKQSSLRTSLAFGEDEASKQGNLWPLVKIGPRRPSSHRTRKQVCLQCEHPHWQQHVPFFACTICEHLHVLCEYALAHITQFHSQHQAAQLCCEGHRENVSSVPNTNEKFAADTHHIRRKITRECCMAPFQRISADKDVCCETCILWPIPFYLHSQRRKWKFMGSLSESQRLSTCHWEKSYFVRPSTSHESKQDIPVWDNWVETLHQDPFEDENCISSLVSSTVFLGSWFGLLQTAREA